MPTYLYRCPVHGEQIVTKPMAQASDPEYCQQCHTTALMDVLATHDTQRVYPHGAMQRVYTPPITDCASFGKSMHAARTPQWRWRPKNEDQAQQFRDIAREEGRRVQFGAGRTTGT